MARIDSKVIFVTTSPRTPAKMIPEIELLNTHFSGQKWNNDTQKAFMQLLKEENFFNGEAANDPAFSARDRITRAPKSLGFVLLSPDISLTPAGLELVSSKRKVRCVKRRKFDRYKFWARHLFKNYYNNLVIRKDLLLQPSAYKLKNTHYRLQRKR